MYTLDAMHFTKGFQTPNWDRKSEKVPDWMECTLMRYLYLCARHAGPSSIGRRRTIVFFWPTFGWFFFLETNLFGFFKRRSPVCNPAINIAVWPSDTFLIVLPVYCHVKNLFTYTLTTRCNHAARNIIIHIVSGHSDVSKEFL